METIKFTEKELELLSILVGTVLMDKEVLKSFDFGIEEKVALSNKIAFLKFQLKNLKRP